MLGSIWKLILSQPTKVKVLLVVIALLSLTSLAYLGQYAYMKRKLFIEYKGKVKRLELELEESSKREQQSINIARKKTQSINTKRLSIDNKLKEDEKIIDNDSITDDDIRSFIAKHKER
jgi:hypothetical protein